MKAAIPLFTASLEPGTRVGLFASYLKEDGKKILRFYGWGTYEGDFPLNDEEGVRAYQSATEKYDVFKKMGKICAARLRHDDGTVTWGLLSWWDTVDAIKVYVDQADRVVDVDLKAAMVSFKKKVADYAAFLDLTEHDVNTFAVNKDVQ